MQRTPSRIILARNLNRLMAATYSLNSNTKLVKRSGLGLGTMGRVRNAQVDATTDTIDKLAESFGIEPWELLAPQDMAQSPTAQPLIEFQPAAPAEPAGIQPSATARELGVLFDLLTGCDGKINRAEVFTAAVEAISRAVTGRHAPPTDTPGQLAQARTRVA